MNSISLSRRHFARRFLVASAGVVGIPAILRAADSIGRRRRQGQADQCEGRLRQRGDRQALRQHAQSNDLL